VPESGGGRHIVLAPAARNDIREALLWSQERFGERAAARYRGLLKQALRDIAADPERPDLARGIRTYHLCFSRDRARSDLGIVKRPRHFLVYRRRGEDVIDIVRVLHEARDLERHVPGEGLRNPNLSDAEEGE